MVTLVISITNISVVAAATSVSVATVYILTSMVTMVTKLPFFFGCYNYVNMPTETVKKTLLTSFLSWHRAF